MADNSPESPPNRYLLFFKLFWKSMIIVLVPLVALPVMLLNYTPPFKCLWVVIIMSIFWITEVIPLAATSLIPIVIFPLLDLAPTELICLQYLKSAVILLFAGLAVALAIEYSKLHKRIALRTILCLGCSMRRLMVSFSCVTIVLSFFLVNTACTVMMCPIIMAVLEELESQNLCKIYEDLDPRLGPDQIRRPTRITVVFYTSVAFSASIGGVGTIIGTSANLAAKGIFETRFPKGPEIDFVKWLVYGIPLSILGGIFMCFWIQLIFMGLFRPHSKDAINTRIGKEGEQIARGIISENLKALGPMTFHEYLVAIVLAILVILCFTRKPQIFPGWAEMLTDKKIQDATAGIFAALLCFALPSKCVIQKFFKSGDGSDLPRAETHPLVSWPFLQNKVPWGVIFLLGGGFTVSKVSTDSGMAKVIGESLSGLNSYPMWVRSGIMVALAELLTEFSSNTAISNVIIPIALETAIATNTNPLYLVYPVGLACSFAMLTPVATPPNTVIVGYINLRTKDLALAGIGPKIFSIILLVILTPLSTKLAYPGIGELPDWAKDNSTLFTAM